MVAFPEKIGGSTGLGNEDAAIAEAGLEHLGVPAQVVLLLDSGKQ